MATAAELQIVIEAQDRASGQLRQVGTQVERLERQVQQAGRNAGGGLLGGLLGGINIGAGIRAVDAAIGALGGSFRFIRESVVDLNSQLEQSVTAFRVFTGSAEAAQDVIQALRREADITPFNTREIIDAGAALISSAHGSRDALLDLVRTAEALAAFRPIQQMEGATLALREALEGNFQSIQERFGITSAAIQRFRDQGLTNLQAIQAAMREVGATSALIEGLGRTFEGRTSTIRSFFDELRQRAGAGTFDRLNDLFGRLVTMIERSGDALRQWADMVGGIVGGLLERLAGVLASTLLPLLDRLAPALAELLRGALAELPQQMEATAQSTQRAAEAGETLEHQLGRLGVEGARLQLEADRVRRTYDDQLEPLERQLRLLQQSADLQRVQNALATNRATVDRLRLEREITALQRAARGNVDPNAPGLTLRQRMIALALQERQLQLEQMGIEEQRRPQMQSLEQQIAALQEQRRQALDPLERELQLHKDHVTQLQIKRQETELLKQEAENAAGAMKRAWEAGNDPATLQAANQRGKELADEWLQGWDAWIEANGGNVWQAMVTSFDNWYKAGGKDALVERGTQIARALWEGVDKLLTSLFGAEPGPIGAGMATGRKPGGGIPEALGGGSGMVVTEVVSRLIGQAIGERGVTINFGTGSITLGGANDPGFAERFKQAFTNFFQQFMQSEAATEPGASGRQQGTPR